jgi:uncharacterized protein (DUF952 family)
MKTIIYHITSRAEWLSAQQQGFYTTPSLAAEGFIHCSTQIQVLGVGERYYKGNTDLVLLCIDRKLVTEQVRDEDSHGNGELFPHIYGSLANKAVVKVVDFPPRPDGLFDWPADALME